MDEIAVAGSVGITVAGSDDDDDDDSGENVFSAPIEDVQVGSLIDVFDDNGEENIMRVDDRAPQSPVANFDPLASADTPLVEGSGGDVDDAVNGIHDPHQSCKPSTMPSACYLVRNFYL